MESNLIYKENKNKNPNYKCLFFVFSLACMYKNKKREIWLFKMKSNHA